MAEVAGLSLRTIQRIEKDGTASLESRKALAAALDVTPLDIHVEDYGARDTGAIKSDNLDSKMSSRNFVDHPAPSTGLMILLVLSTIGMIVIIPVALQAPAFQEPAWVTPVVVTAAVFCLLILGYSFWLLDSTYYILDEKGLTVKFGPSVKTYRWADFKTIYWRRGVFTTKIWSPFVTPVVRLSNTVSLQRKHSIWPLNLTPNDPKRFIERIDAFAPQLTQEMLD